LTFDFRLEHQASFSFESDSITEEMRQKHEILFVQKIMIFPWILIVILGVVLIVLQTIHYIWKKKRSHQEDNAINQNAMFQ